jgi:peptide/nickel transport system substrate-binding protein
MENSGRLREADERRAGMKIKSVLAAVLVIAGLGQARAQELTVGSQGDPSLDPHYMYIGTNVAFWRHIFGSLTMHDDQGRAVPSLALSFSPIDAMTWEFRLRPDVKFKDGSQLTADDVVFSLKRTTSIPGNPSSYVSRMESITGFEAVDPLTVRIHTSVHNPYVPDNMVDIAIVSRQVVDGKTTGDFTTLKAVDEYGPYLVSSFTPGDKLVLDRNNAYWGDKPYWKRVTFRVMANDASRVAALLSGGVDFIDFVPPTDVPKLRADPNIAVQDGPSSRMLFLLVNFRKGPVGGVTAADGKPLSENPLLDLRVRQALSKGIDRQALVARVMDGEAIPASQMAIPGMEGYDPKLAVEAYDPQGAKALLAQAGFPNGFGLTLSCSNNRYPNDDRVCQAVGQMLARIGLKPVVETLPMSVLMPKLRGPGPQGSEMGLGMLGLGVQGSRPTALALVIHSANAQIGRGQYNFGHHENAEIDKVIDDALTTVDPKTRDGLLRLAVDRAVAETAIIPLYWQKVVTASRADLTSTTDPSEDTLTWRVRPK